MIQPIEVYQETEREALRQAEAIVNDIDFHSGVLSKESQAALKKEVDEQIEIAQTAHKFAEAELKKQRSFRRPFGDRWNWS